VIRGLLSFVVLGLLGCSGASSGDDDDTSGAPTSCDWVEDRMGTYLQRFTETSGNCGPIPDALGRLDNSAPLPENCALDADDRVTENGCKLERAFTCTDEPNDFVTSTVAVSTQQDEAGALITGKATITARHLDGSTVCVSTYNFRAERQ
jgi:hypothetical protein